MFAYKREILDELARHGLRPRPTSHPDHVRSVVRDLYLYEIRALRDRCRAGEFSTRELASDSDLQVDRVAAPERALVPRRRPG
jgi:hypothetical protein